MEIQRREGRDGISANFFTEDHQKTFINHINIPLVKKFCHTVVYPAPVSFENANRNGLQYMSVFCFGRFMCCN